ncbi:Cytochrome c oxidase polypeptide I+III [Micromonospora sp. MW-13]|uniref:cytochrome c oxidase subunit 3 n=1 Tax=unclassified Micromonospora TaxID=2617518 RepID=UPI000E43AE6B|nr:MULTISPECIES: heme-copper oxidase subunit III [unclassified Micromonospora]MCX4471642.1 heme-copper oxidase subunit III [Micromonospora sp. NBC_01655]RGC66745.1 Cytochrome c oxidase polypeptide I+III [Micromonospora sp. MW-13]
MTDPAGIVTAATRAESLSAELPAGRSTGWWGMVMFVATEATLFACLLGSYYYLRFQYGPQWPPPGIEAPSLLKPLVMTAVLLPSSLPMLWAEHGIRRGQRWRLRSGLAATMLLGITFLALQATEYAEKLRQFTMTTDAYGSLFYLITGFHGLHVLIGLTMIGWLLAASLRGGSFGAHRHDRVRNAAIYWHFVDAVWAAILFTIYLTPRL